jgi:hypothetical protein
LYSNYIIYIRYDRSFNNNNREERRRFHF